MTGIDDLTIRCYADGDGPGIVKLLNDVFGENNPHYDPRTVAEWEWVYRQNPAGHQIIVAETPDGEIVGHYACIPYRTSVRGEVATCGQGVDSMVRADFRRGLKTEGLFLRTARHYFETYGVPEQNAYGYGFPNPKAFRIGVRMLKYEPIHAPLVTLGRNLFALTPDEDEVVGVGADPGGSVVEIDRFGAAADALWAQLAPEYALGTIRDARYLNWRYLDCPFGTHRAFALVNDDGSWRGAIVCRIGWAGPSILALSEFLVPGEDRGAALRLLAHAVGWAREIGQQRVEVWFPPWHPFHGMAATHGFHAEKSPFNLCIKIYRPDLHAEWARSNWMFSIGDTDVF